LLTFEFVAHSLQAQCKRLKERARERDTERESEKYIREKKVPIWQDDTAKKKCPKKSAGCGEEPREGEKINKKYKFAKRPKP